MGFAALTVVGDGMLVSAWKGKSKEVPAVQKAMEEARRNLVRFHSRMARQHAVIGHHGASTVIMQPASKVPALLLAVQCAR